MVLNLPYLPEQIVVCMTGMNRHEAVNQGLASLQVKPSSTAKAKLLGRGFGSNQAESPPGAVRARSLSQFSNTITPSIGDISIRIIDHDKGSSQFTPGIVSVTFWVS